MFIMSELTPYETRMEKMKEDFEDWWDDSEEPPEVRAHNAEFFEGSTKEMLEAAFNAGYRMGGHTPWTSINPTQMALFAKLFAEKQNERQ